MKKLLSFLLVLALSLTIAAPGVTYAASTKLNETKLSINVGKTYTLKLSGASGTVKWSTSNKYVASVSSKGKVTALSNGNAVITAQYKKKKYKCNVKVNIPAGSVSVTVPNLLGDIKEINDYLSSIGIKYIVVNDEEFTTTITMTKSQQQQALTYFREVLVAAIADAQASGDIPDYYKTFNVNDDFTEIDAYVDKNGYTIHDPNEIIPYDDTQMALIIYSGLYQSYAGVKDDDMKFVIKVYDNETKELIDTINSDDYK